MNTLLVGWDVGAWNCDGGDSRDAVVALTGSSMNNLALAGRVYRGNLRGWICESGVEALLDAVQISPAETVVAAVDTPLGWPAPFVRLLQGQGTVSVCAKADGNPYMFRRTELDLFQRGFRPLSAVRDMIGSQATKGQFLIAHSALPLVAPGVWQAGRRTVIETYPTPLRSSPWLSTHFERLASNDAFLKTATGKGATDIKDALWCALAAATWAFEHARLTPPPNSEEVPSEGWIWVPDDARKIA
jgi:hypothetical protein